MLMRKKGFKKNPACSMVEGQKGVIHEFFAGDMNHPKSVEIKKALEDLLARLKHQGYKPNLSSVPYNISDDQKKQLLMAHSEKLALAFGLISSCAGCVIRIVKNLRICEDCHVVMCGASEITGREIIIRDNLRFHHFRDGKCSCGNFWKPPETCCSRTAFPKLHHWVILLAHEQVLMSFGLQEK
ncbi:E+ motif [Dillenia turbinata]|uniref:E+ motif n=1 Tax=Dillenia turbinata TaxID=194707 RepID=A0AAN8ZQ39_9MAGN